MTLSIVHLYDLVGAILALPAVATLADRQHPKRYSSALFWGLYALVFLIGDQLPPVWVGVGAIVMALIAGFGGVGAMTIAPTPTQTGGNWSPTRNTSA